MSKSLKPSKKLRVLALSSLSSVVGTFPAIAQDNDYLEPEPSIYTDPFGYEIYDASFINRIEEMYGFEIQARALIIPDGQPEQIVGLRVSKHGDLPVVGLPEPIVETTYSIIVLNFEFSLSNFAELEELRNGSITISDENNEDITQKRIDELEAILPDTPEDVRIFRCEKAIDQKVAEKILSIWKKMVIQTRNSYPMPQQNHRGITYHFAYQTGEVFVLAPRPLYGGYTRAPIAGTKVNQFVNITHRVSNVCSSTNPKDVEDLVRNIEILEKRIADEQSAL